MATFVGIKKAATDAGKEIDDITIAFTMGFVAGSKAKAKPTRVCVTGASGKWFATIARGAAGRWPAIELRYKL